MPALAPDTFRPLAETPADLADGLREVLAPQKPLQEHPDIPRAAEGDLSRAELRAARRDMSAPHPLHHVGDDHRALHGSAEPGEPGCCWCR